MADWVCVVDDDQVSERQKSVLQSLKPTDTVVGMIECDKPSNQLAPTCSGVEYFPAFCNTKTNVCLYGLRETKEEIGELKNVTQR